MLRDDEVSKDFEKRLENMAIPPRFCNGTQAEMIVSVPFSSPDPPNPAIALPTINILED
jgi:hypothetical protein